MGERRLLDGGRRAGRSEWGVGKGCLAGRKAREGNGKRGGTRDGILHRKNQSYRHGRAGKGTEVV